MEVARGRTIRQIETLVAGHKPGDLPTDPADASRVHHALRFDVSAETLATFREAMAKLRRDAEQSLDDDAALLLLARHILGGPTESGRSSYQIALTTCDQCKRTWQDGRGEKVEVGADIVEMTNCDAQHIGDVATPNSSSAHVGVGEKPKPNRAHQDIPPAARREVMRRHGGRCAFQGVVMRSSWTSITWCCVPRADSTTPMASSCSVRPITARNTGDSSSSKDACRVG